MHGIITYNTVHPLALKRPKLLCLSAVRISVFGLLTSSMNQSRNKYYRPHLVCLVSAVLLMIVQAAQADEDGLQQRLVNIQKEHNVSALGLALVHRDKVLLATALGVGSWEDSKAVNEHSLFRLGSITKSFTGLAALKLEQHQKPTLLVDVNSLVPDLVNDERYPGTATLRQLLEHTAGLSDLSKEEFDFQGATVTFGDAVQISPKTRTLLWPAGMHSSYSNAGYGLAGYVLETRYEEPYESLVAEQVLGPLEMNNSGFFPEPEQQLVAGYDSDGKTPIPYWHMIYRSFGGLNSTPADMALFLQALLGDSSQENGSFLNAQEVTDFEQPQTSLAAQSGLTYGYGLGNYQWLRNGVLFHGHGGDADGYLSHYGYNRASGYGYFVVINAFNHKALRAVRNELESFIIKRSPKEKPTKQSGTLPNLDSYVGEYQAATSRFSRPSFSAPTLRISKSGNTLYTDYKNDREALVWVNGPWFRRPWQPVATYAFVEDEQGALYLQGDLGNFRKIVKSPP